MSILRTVKYLVWGVAPLVSVIASSEAWASRVEIDAPVFNPEGKPVIISLLAKDFQDINGGGLNFKFDPRMFEFRGVFFSLGGDQEGDDILLARQDEIRFNGFSRWDFHTSYDGDKKKFSQGRIENIAFASTEPVSGDALIAFVELRPLKNGVSELSLSQNSKSPFSSAGFPLSVELDKHSIVVGQAPTLSAPIPGHVPGLIGLGLFFYWRRKSA